MQITDIKLIAMNTDEWCALIQLFAILIYDILIKNNAILFPYIKNELFFIFVNNIQTPRKQCLYWFSLKQ